MHDDRKGQIAVMFLSHRTGADDAGYDKAAAAMDALAACQPGYRGIVSTRGADGVGITISYWADEAAAIAWRDDPEHAAVRERGRELWYDRYEVIVAGIGRNYAWTRA